MKITPHHPLGVFTQVFPEPYELKRARNRMVLARTAYGEDAPISGPAKMWAQRYADDVELLFAKIGLLERTMAALEKERGTPCP